MLSVLGVPSIMRLKVVNSFILLVFIENHYQFFGGDIIGKGNSDFC